MAEGGDTRRVQAIVHGRVQGVNFRYYTQRQGRSLSLKGYVRNRPDGTVEVVAEGPEQDVRALLAWLHEGPRLARVRQVEVQWQSGGQSLPAFEVRY